MSAADTPGCCVEVYSPRMLRVYPCGRRGVVERYGKHYCKQHDPEAVKARRAAADKAYNDRVAGERRTVIACGLAWATVDQLRAELAKREPPNT